MVLSAIFAGMSFQMAPPLPAEFPEKVLPVMSSVPLVPVRWTKLEKPPPVLPAEFPENVAVGDGHRAT